MYLFYRQISSDNYEVLFKTAVLCNHKNYIIKISPVREAVDSWERRRHLANVIAIAKAFANWTKTLPSSKSRDTKTRTDIKNLLHTKVRYCSFRISGHLKMAEELDFENWRISNFKGLVTLTLDRVIQHTIVFHLSTSTYIPNFIGIGKTFCGRTYGRTSETHFIRSTLRSRPNNTTVIVCSP